MSFECLTCNSAFDSRRGLGVHHSLVHDERLPNRDCANCNDEFYCSYAKKYCSENCRQEGMSFENEANPNYRGGKAEAGCRICGTTFEYYSSAKKGLYCPDWVEDESWRVTPDTQGPDHPQWSGGKLTRECVVCKATIERYPSDFSGDVAVCSEECRRAWLSTAFTGSSHPNWKGGGNESYGTGWRSVRRQALKRDGYACVWCSKTKQKLGRNPDVHHTVPVRSFEDSADHEKADAHSLENVASLCIACHRKADFGKISRETLRTLVANTAGQKCVTTESG